MLISLGLDRQQSPLDGSRVLEQLDRLSVVVRLGHLHALSAQPVRSVLLRLGHAGCGAPFGEFGEDHETRPSSRSLRCVANTHA